jgi:glycosyltransferase involved in cell wall biosynthesis
LFTSTSHFFVDAVHTFNQYDAIIVGPESIGLGISHFILNGTVRPPMFVMAMGMLLYTQSRVSAEPLRARVKDIAREFYYRFAFGRYRKRRRIYRHLLEASRGMLYFERSETEIARRMFPEFAEKMHFSVSCIDTDFWRPSLATNGTGTRSDVILFMGSARGRDFGLILDIARHLPHFRFVFVTHRIRQEQVSPNVTLKRGDWKTNLISDVEIRRIVQDSALVVLPFKPGDLHSLTSVALQAMACGKPVLVSKTSAIWEPEFIDRQHVWFVHSGTLSEWCESIETLMRDSVTREQIGAHARRLVEQQNNLTVLGSTVEALIKQ